MRGKRYTLSVSYDFVDLPSFDQLSPEARSTGQTIVAPLIQGMRRVEIARALGISRHDIRHRLDRFREQLEGKRTPLYCARCNRRIERPRPNRVYCGGRCRVAAHRASKCPPLPVSEKSLKPGGAAASIASRSAHHAGARHRKDRGRAAPSAPLGHAPAPERSKGSMLGGHHLPEAPPYSFRATGN